MDNVISTISFLLFFTFLISSIPKIVRLNTFIDLTVQYQLLPKSLSRIYGAILPFIELGASVLIILNGTALYGALIILFLLSNFLIAVFYAIKKKKSISCGCYGAFIDSKADAFTITKIILLIFIVVSLLFFRNSQPIVQHETVSILVGIFLGMMLLIFQKVWTLYQKTQERIQNI